MKNTLQLACCTLAVLCIAISSATEAQTTITPEQQTIMEKAYRDQMAHPPALLPGAVAIVPPPSAAAGAPPSNPATGTAGGTPAAVRSPTVPQYTVRDKQRLESELKAVNSQLKIREVTEANTEHASDAIAARGKILFTYVEGGIYEVQAATLRQTAIQLQTGEVLTGRDLPTAGDTARWLLAVTRTGAAPNESIVLIVKPIEAGLETNMTITTNRRIYNIMLKSTERTFMPIVGWTYPQDEARLLEVAEQKAAEVESLTEPLAVDPARLNFDCTVKGADAVWKPLRAYDDGVKTYLQMDPTMSSYEAPALFVMEAKQPMLVNYRVKKSVYIVDRLFEHGQLRIGKKNAVDILCTRKLARFTKD